MYKQALHLTSARKELEADLHCTPAACMPQTRCKRYEVLAVPTSRKKRFRSRAGQMFKRAVNKVGMRPTLLKTSEYVNGVAKMMVQKVFPTFCASLPFSVKPEIVGNRFELGFSGDVFDPSM
jgi:hypothetical protein